MLEEEMIEVIPDLLRERIAFTTPIVAATGKPALFDKPAIGTYITYEKYHGNVDALETWAAIQWEPLSRLAAWLANNKEEAQIEYPRVEHEWEYEEMGENDYSIFAPGESGKILMKTIPNDKLENVSGYKVSFGGGKSPYWHPENYMEIAVPC
jgi:hypothetical protein